MSEPTNNRKIAEIVVKHQEAVARKRLPDVVGQRHGLMAALAMVIVTPELWKETMELVKADPEYQAIMKGGTQ